MKGNKKIEVYKITPYGKNPLYSKLDELDKALEFLNIGYMGIDLNIKKRKIEEWEFESLPEHNGF